MSNSIEKMITDMELRGMSETTKESYLRHVQLFIKFVGIDTDRINMEDIRNYIIYLKDVKSLSYGTINAHISGIKFFYSIALERDWDEKKVPRMRGYKSFPAVLSKNEVLDIINAVDNLKYKSILMLMYGSGLRVSEAAKLKVSNIDSKNFQILVSQSKNKSDRYAILPQRTLEVLRTYWLAHNKPRFWLFIGAKNDEHISTKSIKNFVIRLKHKLKITKNISAHTFRHCFATHLLEAGTQLPHIQHLMGHKSLKSTTRYLHMTSKAMMNIKSPIDLEDSNA